MEKCKEVMRNAISCQVNDATADIVPIMRSHNFNSIPVIENVQTQELVGIVTLHEVAMRILSDWCEGMFSKVDSITIRDIGICHPDDDLQIALDAMIKHQMDLVPIVDHDDRILGIIAKEDVSMYLRGLE